MEDPFKRQTSLPVLYVRGSFYDIGYNVGRTFCGMIKRMIETHPSLNNEYIPAYNTKEGRVIYDETYQSVLKYYPQYIRELEGLADGAQIPFYKLFLLHIDDVLPGCLEQSNATSGCQGCSTICLNGKEDVIIGHTEDAFKEVLNNIYILNAHVTESQPEERFTAFCYAGLLPGYAMGFNKYGFIYSINIIGSKHLGRGKLPRTFVTRALLGSATSLETAINILSCKGCGIADAMSVNLTFLNEPGDRQLYNIEVSPNSPDEYESTLSVKNISPGHDYFHANKFLRLDATENEGPMYESSNVRHKTRENHSITDAKSVLNLLGDTTDTRYSVFRSIGPVWTIAVGIFDCKEKTWAIYLNNPKTSEPIVKLPLLYY